MPQIARNFPNFWKLQAVENQQKLPKISQEFLAPLWGRSLWLPFPGGNPDGLDEGYRAPTILPSIFPYDNKWLDMDF